MGYGQDKFLLGLQGILDGFSLTLTHYHFTMFSQDLKETSHQTNLTILVMTSQLITIGFITLKVLQKFKTYMESCQDGLK